MHSTLDQVVCVRVLAGERHFTHVVPLSTQVYKWIPVNLMLATPRRFMLQKLEISKGMMGLLARVQTSPLPVYLCNRQIRLTRA